ncbi:MULTISPECIES: hypothetical protein [Parachlamydia]|uniref:Uncharacterized protein n=1 Tax=Parachlamydia acanthamoebae (strain UV7) TaxID=765952 RepID=F8L2C8_PARAV|nr:hypothetical protein [Parachlamydia acanthamoebae]CCB87441.1 unknown protein [Parachlamydia acanthamoebae UV-7]
MRKWEMNPKWFKDYLAYTMSKYGMSLYVLGMAAEFVEDGIAAMLYGPKQSLPRLRLWRF